MKNVRTFALFASIAVLLGLGGCASTNTPKRNLAAYNVGEQTIYGMVIGRPIPLPQVKGFDRCGKEPTVSSSQNEWSARNVCDQGDKWQYVRVLHHTAGMKMLISYAPHDLKLETDDIVEVISELSAEGELTKPALIKRIARKGKDATKASGCWWDAGKWATSQIFHGGVVCDGWNWRDQKWAKK
jgi:hypothetical protein